MKTLFIWLVFGAIAVWFLSHVHIKKTKIAAVAATNQTQSTSAQQPIQSAPVQPTQSAPAQQPIRKMEFKKARPAAKSGGVHRALDGTIK